MFIEAMSGDHISVYARRLINAAKEHSGEGIKIEGSFNGIKLMVTESNSVKEVSTYYNQQLRKKSKSEDVDKESQTSQEFVDSLIKQLSEVDMTDLEPVLDWLCIYQDKACVCGIEKKKEIVIDYLDGAGYTPNAFVHKEFDETDKNKYGRYIIGQCLNSLIESGSIPDVIHRFVKEWKEKFGATV